MLMAMRHALTKYPDCKYVWYLDQDAYIMDISKSLESVVLSNSKLESLKIKDHPVVPPDSIIKTFGHLRANDIDLILSQDKTGLVHNNIILRNGEWAKFFLETWMDPLYRSYNFQKAERHALVRGLYVLKSLGVDANLFLRNTLFNGTRQSWPNWPSSLSEHSPHTSEPTWAIHTKTATLLPCLLAAQPRAARAAKPYRATT